MPGPLRRLARRLLGWVISDEPPDSFLRWPGVTAPTASGVSVTDDSALRITAVLSCVKVIAETISTLPLRVFEKQANGDRRLADDHPLDGILHDAANEEISHSSSFVEAALASLWQEAQMSPLLHPASKGTGERKRQSWH